MSDVFQNIDPHPPSPPSECTLPPHQRRGGNQSLAGQWGGGGPDIGLASYSIISLRLKLSVSMAYVLNLCTLLKEALFERSCVCKRHVRWSFGWNYAFWRLIGWTCVFLRLFGRICEFWGLWEESVCYNGFLDESVSSEGFWMNLCVIMAFWMNLCDMKTFWMNLCVLKALFGWICAL